MLAIPVNFPRYCLTQWIPKASWELWNQLSKTIDVVLFGIKGLLTPGMTTQLKSNLCVGPANIFFIFDTAICKHISYSKGPTYSDSVSCNFTSGDTCLYQYQGDQSLAMWSVIPEDLLGGIGHEGWPGNIWWVHDDVIKWKHFPSYWPFVRGIHRSPVNFLHKGQWRGGLMFSFICAWINRWVNNGEAGDLRRYRAHYDVIVMPFKNYKHCYYLHHTPSPWISRIGYVFCFFFVV